MIVDVSISQLLRQISSERLLKLSGRSVWIVGGGSGYGKAIALLLAAAGSRVFISGRDRDKLQKTQQMAELMQLNAGTIEVVPMDLTNPKSLDRAIAHLEAQIDALYGLVLTAAIPQTGPTQTPLLDFSLEQWNRMMATNVSSTFLLVQKTATLLSASNSSRIICFSSRAAWFDTLGFGPYNISKCALNSYVASAARELAYRYSDRDIQINAIDPGEAFTEMNQGSPTPPLAISNIVLHLLTTSSQGPSGKFFDRDLNPMEFNAIAKYDGAL